jgi:hypothetical protein
MELTKVEFGGLLRTKILAEGDMVALSRWAYQIYLDNSRNLEYGLKDVLLDLGRMEEAPEFEYSPADLAELADALVSGKR